MRTAYSYQRWSTASQGENGKDSALRQSKSASEWIQSYGGGKFILSDDVFLDAGKSGFKGKHIEVDEYGKAKGELMRFIQLVEEGKIKRDSILLIDDFSRFSRMKPTKSMSLFLQVLESEIGLVFTGSMEKRVINMELIDSEGYVLQFVIGEMIRSYNESAERGRKIKSAIQNKIESIKNGVIRRSHLPSYYTFVPNDGEKKVGKYIHNDRTVIMQEIVKMYLSGKTLYGISEAMNERQIKSPTGAEWSDNNISWMLKQRTLMGEYKGVKNYAPPVISEKEFIKVQNLLKQNSRNRGKKGTFINIFKSITFCSDCGKSMEISARYFDYRLKVKFERPYRYMKCSNHGRKVSCQNRGLFNLDDMEYDFFLSFLYKTPQQLMNEDDNSELKGLNESIATKQAKFNRITTEINKLIALSDTVELDELKSRLAKLNNEREQLKADLDGLNLQKSKVVDSPYQFDNLRKLVEDSKAAAKLATTHEEALAQLDTTEGAARHRKHFEAIESTIDTLKDNYTREGIRIMIPTLIGKITVDIKNKRYHVYNRVGKLIYTMGQ